MILVIDIYINLLKQDIIEDFCSFMLFLIFRYSEMYLCSSVMVHGSSVIFRYSGPTNKVKYILNIQSFLTGTFSIVTLRIVLKNNRNLISYITQLQINEVHAKKRILLSIVVEIVKQIIRQNLTENINLCFNFFVQSKTIIFQCCHKRRDNVQIIRETFSLQSKQIKNRKSDLLRTHFGTFKQDGISFIFPFKLTIELLEIFGIILLQYF